MKISLISLACRNLFLGVRFESGFDVCRSKTEVAPGMHIGAPKMTHSLLQNSFDKTSTLLVCHIGDDTECRPGETCGVIKKGIKTGAYTGTHMALPKGTHIRQKLRNRQWDTFIAVSPPEILNRFRSGFT